jgi:hypothetical protein
VQQEQTLDLNLNSELGLHHQHWHLLHYMRMTDTVAEVAAVVVTAAAAAALAATYYATADFPVVFVSWYFRAVIATQWIKEVI